MKQTKNIHLNSFMILHCPAPEKMISYVLFPTKNEKKVLEEIP